MNFISRLFGRPGRCSGTHGGPDTWTGNTGKNTDLKKCPFVIFDTELSGLDKRKDFIVSIGALKMDGALINMSSEYYRLIKPEAGMTKKSIEIHGITPGELEEKPDMDAILPDFLDFIKDSILVGHFLNIDIMFINREIKKRYHCSLANPGIDTHDIHEWLCSNSDEFRRHYRGGSSKTDLFSVAGQCGIPVTQAHNAMSDAYITAQLFQKFLFFLHTEGVQKLGELLTIGRA